MPQSPAISPRFSDRYPEAAIIFENLHSLHDVVPAILADWKAMADAMGLPTWAAPRRSRPTRGVDSADDRQ
jgi:hypothetical protein